jgi:hypothetical protein
MPTKTVHCQIRISSTRLAAKMAGFRGNMGNMAAGKNTGISKTDQDIFFKSCSLSFLPDRINLLHFSSTFGFHMPSFSPAKLTSIRDSKMHVAAQ